jgi:peptide-methionine (S)-S-oxide reductase
MSTSPGPSGQAASSSPAGADSTEVAIFAMGCFWGPELRFSKIPGVVDCDVGYIGGHVDNPTYRQVCTDTTGHAEAVRIRFNPSVVSYEQLVDFFFAWHDPTQVNRQGPDVGSQYRSAIFYTTEAQRRTAESKKAAIAASGKYRLPIATQIVPADTFWRAEEYHQDYLQKKGYESCPSESVSP